MKFMEPVIRDQAGLEEMVNRLVNRPILACDLETTGLDPHRDTVLLVQFGDDRIQTAVDARAFSDLSLLGRVLERDGITIFHNAQFDLKFLKKIGLNVSRPQDTMLLEMLIAGGRKVGPRTLKACCERRVGLNLDKSERTSFMNYEGDLTDAQIEYGLADVLATYHLFLEQTGKINSLGLSRIARIEGAATEAFADLEYHGINFDADAWNYMIEKNEASAKEAFNVLCETVKPVKQADLFGHVEVNFESDAEIRNLFQLFGFDNLPDLTRHTISCIDHPFAKALLEYRTYQQILSSHGKNFLSHIHPETGRIHPRFKQIGAATGRSACENPNLQSISSKDGFRSAFSAPEGRLIITADYSACELRILGELSGEPGFLDAFAQNEDLHSKVASRIFRKKVSKEENPELRARAKAINFGLCYGMGAAGLARQTGCDPDEAASILEKYFQTYPRVAEWLEETANESLSRGYCETMSGRRLYLEGIEDPEQRHALVRQAKNMPVQGTSADIIKLAMARICRLFRQKSYDAFFVNCVHDELVVETASDTAEEVAEALRQEMVAAGEAFLKKTPVEVDVNISKHWTK